MKNGHLEMFVIYLELIFEIACDLSRVRKDGETISPSLFFILDNNGVVIPCWARAGRNRIDKKILFESIEFVTLIFIVDINSFPDHETPKISVKCPKIGSIFSSSKMMRNWTKNGMNAQMELKWNLNGT